MKLNYLVGTNSYTVDKNTKQTENNNYLDSLKEMETKLKVDSPTGTKIILVSVQAIATTSDKIITYDLTLGNNQNWYLVPNNIVDIEKDEPVSDFATTMEYTAVDENGKKVEAKELKKETDPFLAPYYENEDKNAKKDTDVIVTIKSKTEEEIVETNGVAIRNDGKANSEGWYYPDLKDKTVIAKKYLFDDYDNTTDNGKVSETVKLTGSKGGEDTQKPSIKWTFRRIDITETENKDGSITVAITYNLPVDEDSIPADWTPVYDEDGKTIHKIQRVIKKGEDYDKDVTVKQNGTDATVTTHVKHIWPKTGKSEAPNLGPQAGESLIIAFAVIASIGICVLAYRKFKK